MKTPRHMRRRKPALDLGEALIMFGKLRTEHPECAVAARLGQRLVREIQHLHTVLKYVRRGLPSRYGEYPDPLRVDMALARTVVNSDVRGEP